jgi:hypothetical protein
MSTPPAETKTPEEVARCTECGMWCEPGEFHPFAACLMFRASADRRVVRANLRIAHPDLIQAERDACAERASKAVLAEGRGQYEANRVWWAVRGREPKP